MLKRLMLSFLSAGHLDSGWICSCLQGFEPLLGLHGKVTLKVSLIMDRNWSRGLLTQVSRKPGLQPERLADRARLQELCSAGTTKRNCENENSFKRQVSKWNFLCFPLLLPLVKAGELYRK